MDKKKRRCRTDLQKRNRGSQIEVPHKIIDDITAIQKALQKQPGIGSLSRRKVVEILIKHWQENNQGQVWMLALVTDAKEKQMEINRLRDLIGAVRSSNFLLNIFKKTIKEK
jgi:hypothetical protein